MEKIELTKIKLVGLSLKSKTTNENGQANIDCGNLWQQFEADDIANKIEGKLSDEVFAVYHNYDGDYTQPFSYFIGCKVASNSNVPDGLDSLIIPTGTFIKKRAKGKMPDCIANAWQKIWSSDLPRAYKTDFEVYDERSQDWNDAEVDIYISVQ